MTAPCLSAVYALAPHSSDVKKLLLQWYSPRGCGLPPRRRGPSGLPCASKTSAPLLFLLIVPDKSLVVPCSVRTRRHTTNKGSFSTVMAPPPSCLIALPTQISPWRREMSCADFIITRTTVALFREFGFTLQRTKLHDGRLYVF